MMLARFSMRVRSSWHRSSFGVVALHLEARFYALAQLLEYAAELMHPLAARQPHRRRRRRWPAPRQRSDGLDLELVGVRAQELRQAAQPRQIDLRQRRLPLVEVVD